MDGLLSIRPRRGLAVVAALTLAFGTWVAAPPPATAASWLRFYLPGGQNLIDGASVTFYVHAMADEHFNDDCYGGTVHFSDPKSIVPPDYTFNNTSCSFFLGGDQGVHEITIIPVQPGLHTLTVTDVNYAGLTGSTTFYVSPGPATHLSLSPWNGPSATAGNSKGFLLTALDAYGYTATSFAETVYFTSSDASAVKPSPVAFIPDDNGQRLVSATFATAGSQSLTAMAQPSGFMAQANVSVVATPYFAVDIDDTSTAGEYTGFIVCAFNANGTKYADYAGTITYTISDPNPAAELPSSYTFTPANDNGCIHVDLYGVRFVTAGAQSMTVTDTVNSGFTGTGYTNVIGGSVHDFYLWSSSATMQAGELIVGVALYDAYGNYANNGTVSFASDDPAATLPSPYTYHLSDQGWETFSLTLRTAGTTAVTVHEYHVAYNRPLTVNVLPAAADHLTVGGIASPRSAGVAASPVVVARDPYGNVDPNYHGTVHFTSTDTKAALPADYTFVGADAGSHTFTDGLTLKTAGKQAVRARDTLTATITGLASNIVVKPGPLAAFWVGGLTTPRTAGTGGTLGVKAIDAYGNTITGYTGTVHLTSTDAQALLPADYTFVAGDAGVHGFSVTLKTAGLQAVRARDTVNTPITGIQQRVSVNPAAAATLVVSGIADPYTAATSDPFTVTAKDTYGNVATGYRGTVHFTSTDAAAVLPANYTFVAADRGVHSFSLTLNTLGEQAVRARDTVTGSITGLVRAITVTH